MSCCINIPIVKIICIIGRPILLSERQSEPHSQMFCNVIPDCFLSSDRGW